MDIGINEVKDMIESLESNGEVSIKEEKYLKVAKLCVQLAAENVALKEKLNKLDVWPGIEFYSSSWEFNNNDGIEAIKFMFDIETPATDRIVAGIKADAIDEAAVELDRVDTVASTRVIGFKLREFAKQLREGADK